MLDILLLKKLMGIMELVLQMLTFAVLSVSFIQFFRWLYGYLFDPKLRISFIKVIIPTGSVCFLFLVLKYVDYIIQNFDGFSFIHK